MELPKLFSSDSVRSYIFMKQNKNAVMFYTDMQILAVLQNLFELP